VVVVVWFSSRSPVGSLWPLVSRAGGSKSGGTRIGPGALSGNVHSPAAGVHTMPALPSGDARPGVADVEVRRSLFNPRTGCRWRRTTIRRHSDVRSGDSREIALRVVMLYTRGRSGVKRRPGSRFVPLTYSSRRKPRPSAHGALSWLELAFDEQQSSSTPVCLAHGSPGFDDPIRRTTRCTTPHGSFRMIDRAGNVHVRAPSG